MKLVTLAFLCCFVAVANGQWSTWSVWSSSWTNWSAPWSSSWSIWSPSWSLWSSSWTTGSSWTIWSSWTTWSSSWSTWAPPKYSTMKTGVPKTTTRPITMPPLAPTELACGQSSYLEKEGAAGYQTPQGIVGGVDARMNEFPYQVRIVYNGNFICGGSIISNRHILTAAHCIIGTSPKSFSVILGDHSRNVFDIGEATYNIERIVVHPQNSKTTNKFDVAILVTSTNITWVRLSIRPVCLPETTSNLDALAGQNGIISGWGTTKEGGSTAMTLQTAKVPILTTADCKSSYGASRITDDMMCAGYKSGGIDSCQGDSGGPLVMIQNNRFYLHGVTSWGIGCARQNMPGVYARVTQVIDWIKSTMGPGYYNPPSVPATTTKPPQYSTPPKIPTFQTMKTGVPKTTPGPSPPSGASSCGQSYYTETEGASSYAVPQGIVGGTDARVNEFPYQVGVTFYGSFICGASIISNRHILTAAHCISANTPGSYKVILGDHIRNSPDTGEQTLAISKVFVHPKNSQATNQWDFAMLVTATNITFDRKAIRPICLPDATTNLDSLAGKNAIISGWGTTKEGGSIATVLQKATVPILTVADCKSSYGASRITDDMICAGYKAGGIDACQGDSGGPLVVLTNGRFYLHGVTSWGAGCARKDMPGVYARVTQSIDWIKSTMATS